MAESDHQTPMGDDVPHRAMITICAIGATLLQSLDQTIANVALPYMQGSFSASYDEITWVLTSYITAAAILTAPVGWMAQRFGRKPLYVGCIIGFTIASMLCGAAQSLAQIVGFRLLQGMFSAALVPLSQATLLDIYPPARRGFAMAVWGMGVMIGPIMGPTLGGFLTENYNWRFVFYINLPFGVLATIGLIVFMPRTMGLNRLRFDWFGFTVLSVGVASLQLMLDRGQTLDWFHSTEIIVECVLAGLGIYLFLVHMMSARQPLIRPAIFRDMNFSSGLALMFAMGTLLVSSLALMAPWLQTLSDYPVQTAGLVMAPRGLGNLAAIMFAGRMSTRMDPRLLVGVGLLLICSSFWMMTGWTPDVSETDIIIAIMIQGAGMGLVFTPLQVLAFATLPAAMRTEGASLFSLVRNIGAAIGVSVTSMMLARNTQIMHEVIGGSVTPFNRALAAIGIYDPATQHGAALLDKVVNHQAQIIAYSNDYMLLIYTTLPALLLLLMMRRPKGIIAVKAEPME
ncbi:DHA2 family efflux MFS transporter permease subunit [Rhodopila sp.]|uniref:DHA2 family efflux MFS transporter permease subunit n=1 Tax=Rhodopila sp. TaxID=2480087 RepID=UPI002C34C80F|nr:DHA2 family efflux MFS transporter permease subunit [Rhodopila sp.]HVZ06354.1 DHA2 family efflux MFS transporter permease subunit [Rhodopila sp.]